MDAATLRANLVGRQSLDSNRAIAVVLLEMTTVISLS
jgi:hypothetical protein